MAHHVLKIWPEFFAAVADGYKTAELRRDDRSPAFDRGDTLELHEWNPQTELYTGRLALVRVTFAARGGIVPKGLALLCFKREAF